MLHSQQQSNHDSNPLNLHQTLIMVILIFLIIIVIIVIVIVVIIVVIIVFIVFIVIVIMMMLISRTMIRMVKAAPNVIPIRAISKSRHGGVGERNTLGREQIKHIPSFPRNISGSRIK